MARAVERIEQDLAELEKAIASLAEEFYNIYSGYLSALGPATKQQLILASYHLCTQGHPERFLQLSFAARQQLQQGLQKLVKQHQEQLLLQLQTPSAYASSKLESPSVEIASDSDAEEFSTLEDEDGEDDSSSDAFEDRTEAFLPSVFQNSSVFDPNNVVPQLDTLPATAENEANEIEVNVTVTPEILIRWQMNLEKAIAKSLQRISRDANSLLRQADIIPHQLPEPLLEATTKTASSTDAVTAGPPNLLNVAIEAEGIDDSDNPLFGNLQMPLQLIMIHLRLSEIEFANTTASSWRQQIRNLKGKLNHLGREYQKRQREKAIAEAESAWRASWFEE